MPKVPEINKPMPPKRDTMIICSRGKLTAEDQKQLEAYIEFRRKRHERKTRGKI